MYKNIINLFANITKVKMVMPFYHIVANNEPQHAYKLKITRNTKQFINDIDTLLKHYKPISLTNLYNHVYSGEQLPKKSVFISFDDGLTEFYYNAWPILKQKGIKPTLFINTAFVNNQQMFYRFKAALLAHNININKPNSSKTNSIKQLLNSKNNNLQNAFFNVNYNKSELLDQAANILDFSFSAYLQNYKPYLTTNQLIKLKTEGVDIGVHSVNHPLFNNINQQQQINQVIDSINWLTNNLETGIKTFSFPFTDHGIKTNVFNVLLNSTPRIVDLTFGTAGMKTETIKGHYQRIPVENKNLPMHQILTKQYLYFIAKALAGKNTIARQAT